MMRALILFVLVMLAAGCDGPVEPVPEESETTEQNQAPVIRFIWPDSGQSVFTGSAVKLEVEAVDPEDGLLTGESIRWLNEADSLLATGQTHTTFAPRPESFPGSWEIIVEVRDSKGMLARTNRAVGLRTRILWKKELPATGQIAGNLLALAPGGPLYIGMFDFLAYSLNGELLWQLPVDANLWTHGGGLTVGPTGTAFVLDADGIGSAYSSTGNVLWQRQITGPDPHGRFAIGESGILYLSGRGSNSFGLWRLDPLTGESIWNLPDAGYMDVLVNSDGNATGIMVDSSNVELVRVDSTGTITATAPVTSYAASAATRFAAGDRDGHVFVSNGDQGLSVLDPAEELLWTRELNAYGPVIAADGTIYIRESSFVRALGPDGTVKWQRELSDSQILQTLALVNDGTLYASGASTLYALSTKDGTIRWRIPFESGIASPLVVANDGTIYMVLRDSGKPALLVAIHATAPLAPDAPWPTFRADNQRTARVQG